MIMFSSKQEEQPFKKRFLHLKSYIRKIKEQIQPSQIQPALKQQIHSPTIIQIIPNTHYDMSIQYKKLIRQKQMLKNQIDEKIQKNVVENYNKRQGLNKLRVIPTYIKIFISNIKIQDDLQKINFLLSSQQWQNYTLFRNKLGLVFVNLINFSTTIIDFIDIVQSTIENWGHFIKFYTQKLKKYYIISLSTKEKADQWKNFLKAVCKQYFHLREQKWKYTNIKCKSNNKQIKKIEIQNKKQHKKQKSNYENNTVLNNLAKSNKLKSFQENKNQNNFQKKSEVYEVSNSSFFLSNSTQLNRKQNSQNQTKLQNQRKNRRIKNNFSQEILKYKPKIIDISILQPSLQNKDRSNSAILQPLTPITIKDITKNFDLPSTLLQKLQKKQQLLLDANVNQLIYWNQDQIHDDLNRIQNQTEYHVSSPETNQKSTDDAKLKKSLSQKKNQDSTKIDSIQSPIKIKKVQSVTKQKTHSRQSGSNLSFDKTRDFTLRLQNISSAKRHIKNQIREHYIQSLMQKKAIKQLRKSSGSQIQQKTLLSPNHNRKSTQLKHSLLPQNSFQQLQPSSQQKQSTQQQIEAQQLKNGIVLEKCSKDAWSIRLKKLYLSNTMSEICYSDVQNPHEQKKYLVSDLKSIQYGRFTNGILKHKKKRCDEGRCLLIKINNEGKQKLLQFYLEQSEPIQNLLDFAKKLHDFIQRQNQFEYSS